MLIQQKQSVMGARQIQLFLNTLTGSVGTMLTLCLNLWASKKHKPLYLSSSGVRHKQL